MRYGYSLDQESFAGDCESRRAALVEALTKASESWRYKPGDEITIWTCRIRKYQFSPSVVGIYVMEWLRDHAYGECGDVTNGWPKLSDDQQRALGEVVLSLVTKTAPILFWEAVKIQEHPEQRILRR
jgi:hypothetical protein